MIITTCFCQHNLWKQLKMLPSLGKFRDPKRRASEDWHGDAFGLAIIGGKERCFELNSDNILEIYVLCTTSTSFPAYIPFFVISKSCYFFQQRIYSSTGGSFNPNSRTCFFETSNPAAWQAVLSSARVPPWPNGWKPCSCSRVSRWVAELEWSWGEQGDVIFCINLGLYTNMFLCIYIYKYLYI